MAVVSLRPPLRELAGGRREVAAGGTTVAAVLRSLERLHPRLEGWVLDERGQIRQHVGVFVNGERATGETPVGETDRVHVLPAISGGSDDLELLVGTRKGLFVLRGRRGGQLDVAARAFAGTTVEYAMRDPRTGRYFASVTHGQFGPRLFVADDPTGEWEQADGPRFPEDAGTAMERIWVIQPGEADGQLWAGVAPAALFSSEDGGLTWSLNRGMWDQPDRASWQPGAGGLALHSICPWPGDPSRLVIGISAAGVWLTEDGGDTWRRSNAGLVAPYLPEEARGTSTDLCVHNMHRAPLRPERLFLQFHGGVYRSDDAGESWIDIAAGLPSDFGFPMAIDPRDPDRAWVIPLAADRDRVTPDGRVRVYETRDAGASWTARADGLPQGDAYLTVLRQAFGQDGRDPIGLYFGATSGEVFGSVDGGATWSVVAPHLAPVASVRVA
ncbi:MAG: MoaD/ThiS family protein [Candidatus Velamenicoccus archaeovorus]